MDIQGADGLETNPGPAGFKSPGAHIISACYHRGRKKERIFQRDPAQITPKPVFVLRQRRFTVRLYLIIQPVYQIADGNVALTQERSQGAGQVRHGFSFGNLCAAVCSL